MCVDYSSDLDTHHSIEEAYVFPVLAQRMPSFSNNERHKNAHKVIHAGKLQQATCFCTRIQLALGLDKLKGLATAWGKDPTTFSPTVLRACLDEFKTPLFKHLGEEV